jgi:hypothetical protein
MPDKGDGQHIEYDCSDNDNVARMGHDSNRNMSYNSSNVGNPSNIDIFLRVRPVPTPSQRLQLDQTESKVEFNIPRDVSAGYVNNQREHHEFRFNEVIGPEAKQDEVCFVSLLACSYTYCQVACSCTRSQCDTSIVCSCQMLPSGIQQSGT